MTQQSGVFGLAPARVEGQAEYTGNIEYFNIDPAYSTVIGMNDPVTLVGGLIQLASPGDAFVGTLTGVRYSHVGGGVGTPPSGIPYDKFWDGIATNKVDVRAAVPNVNGMRFHIRMSDAQLNTGTLSWATLVGSRRNHVNGTPENGFSRATLGAVSASGSLYVEDVPELASQEDLVRAMRADPAGFTIPDATRELVVQVTVPVTARIGEQSTAGAGAAASAEAAA